MAGEYSYWLEHTSLLEPQTRTTWQGPQPAAGPLALRNWLSNAGTTWRLFHPMFLVREFQDDVFSYTACPWLLIVPHALAVEYVVFDPHR